MAARTPISRLLGPALIVSACCFVFGISVRNAWAGQAPGGLSSGYIKAAVYQGVVAIAPTTTAILELGNAGRDIAGSSELYLRPRGLSEGQGARIVSNAGVTDMYISSLCLYGTGSEVCQSGVPSGGSDTFWSSIVQSGPYEQLTPATSSQGVTIGTRTSPVVGRGLEIVANTVAPAVVLTGSMSFGTVNGSGAVVGSGAVNISGRLDITRALFTYDNPAVYLFVDYPGSDYTFPWTQAYQGQGTYLSADMFDGTTAVNFSTASTHDTFWKTIVTSSKCVGGTRHDLDCNANSDCSVGGGFCDIIERSTMCVNSNRSQLCSGGVNGGNSCTSAADCPGALCLSMCQTAPATCVANTTTRRTHTVPSASSCLLAGDDCNAWCGSAHVRVCDGSVAPPGLTCSATMISSVYADSGTYVGCSTTGPTSVPTITCDCKNSHAVDYYRITGGGGGDLCTDLFLPST